MKETEKVSFDSIPPLIRGLFLTKEQEEKLKEPFKDVMSVVRCKDCIYGDDFDCPVPLPTGYVCQKGHGSHTGDWFCADGERKEL